MAAGELTLQTVDMNGTSITFTDFNTNSDGFACRVRGDATATDGRRRFLWIRNNSGVSSLQFTITIGHRQASSDHVFGRESSSIRYQGMWFNYLLDDTDEWFWGPWDPAMHDLGGTVFSFDHTGYFNIRPITGGGYTAGTTAGADAAWIELAP